MQRLLPLLLLAVVLLGGLLLLWPTEAAPEISPTPTKRIEQENPKPSLVGVGFEKGLSRLEEPLTEVLEPKDLSTTPKLAKENSITVEVWNLQEKRGVPFARIYLENKNDSPRRYSNANGFKNRLTLNGEVFQCDENGRMQAPRTWLNRWAGAEGDGLWGTTRLTKSTHRDIVRIDIHADRNLVVKIVDANGQPQPGVSAHIVGSRFGSLRTLLSAKSDSQGIATLFQTGDPFLAESGIQGVAILIGDPPAPSAPTLVPLSELPNYVERVLPETAKLELRLLDLAGDPILRDVPVKLNLLQPGDDSTKHALYTVFTAKAVSHGGVCTFQRVPPDCALQLQIDFAGIGDTELIPVSPLSSGENRALELQQQHEYPRLSFRVLDGAGSPLAHQMIHFSVKGDINYQGNRSMQSQEVTTDGEGRVFFDLAHPNMEWRKALIFTRQLVVAAISDPSERQVSGHIDLSRDFPMGEHELGDVTLLPPIKIAFGGVIDKQGVPIVGVRVGLQYSGSHATGQGNSEGYSIQYGKTATTDSQGNFEIWGKMPKKGSKLGFMKSGYPSKSMDWIGFEQSYNVVMERDKRAMIAGRVLLPQGLEERGIKLAYYPGTQAEADPYKHKGAYSREEGYFRITGLPEEPGFLEVGVGSGWPFLILHVVEDIQPWQQGEPVDPRLNPLDLRESLRVFEVEMKDSNGNLIPDINFISVFQRPSGGTTSRGRSSADGKGAFLSAENSFNLIAEAKGFRTAKLTLSEEHTVVTMLPALQISLDLSWMPELNRQQSVRLDLDSIDGSSNTGLIENELFTSDGSLFTFISEPGVYEVSLGIFENGGSSWTPLLNPAGENVIIQVMESDEVQNFHLDPPRDFFDDLLRTPSD